MIMIHTEYIVVVVVVTVTFDKPYGVDGPNNVVLTSCHKSLLLLVNQRSLGSDDKARKRTTMSL